MSRFDRNILLSLATLLVWWSVPASVLAMGGSVTLRDRVRVLGPEVTLADVARLQGDYAESLGDVVLGEVGEGKTVQITMQQVRRKLDERQVHWGRLVCRGAQRVTVEQGEAPEVIARREAEARPIVVANPISSVKAEEPEHAEARTVRGHLQQWIRQQVEAHSEAKVSIAFDENDAPLLDAPLGRQRLELEPLGTSPIGRVPVVVRRYAADGAMTTDRLRVEVTVTQPTVVARRTLSRGQIITEQDLAVEHVAMSSLRKQPLMDVMSAVGKVSASLIREGAVVHVDDVRAPILVRRGQVVTVRAVSGGIVVRTVARAMGEGEQGDLIVLRNERTREQFHARVTGPQEAVMLLDGDEQLAQESGR